MRRISERLTFQLAIPASRRGLWLRTAARLPSTRMPGSCLRLAARQGLRPDVSMQRRSLRQPGSRRAAWRSSFSLSNDVHSPGGLWRTGAGLEERQSGFTLTCNERMWVPHRAGSGGSARREALVAGLGLVRSAGVRVLVAQTAYRWWLSERAASRLRAASLPPEGGQGFSLRARARCSPRPDGPETRLIPLPGDSA